MADKIFIQHTVAMENRREVKLTGVTQVVSYDEFKIIVRTDYGRLVIGGRNLAAGQLSVEDKTMQLTGDIDFLQYQKNRGKSESGLSKLLR